MKIKLIDFGVPEHQRPYRPHGNDAGADVYLPYDCTLQPGEIAKIPLGFGLEIPDGYVNFWWSFPVRYLGFFPGSSFWRHWCCSLSQVFCQVLHGL